LVLSLLLLSTSKALQLLWITLEAISRPQIRFEGKAKADEKAQHTREYVSILHKPPDRHRRDGLKYKAKRVLEEAIKRPGLSFA
jgi:hypothetical protein